MKYEQDIVLMDGKSAERFEARQKKRVSAGWTLHSQALERLRDPKAGEQVFMSLIWQK